MIPDRLMPGQQLNVNQELLSQNGRVKLIMQADGNLVLYRVDDGVPLWATNTWGTRVTHAVMQTDGNFVLYDDGGKPYWSTGTWGRPGNWLVLQNDGNLVLYTNSGQALWASNTVQAWPMPTDRLTAGQQLHTNERLVSANGRVTLIMQDDGNLVLYRTDNNEALWASNTYGEPVTHAIMQDDGNFVVYDDAGKPYWSSNTWGNPGAWVIAQDDGNLVVYSSLNAPLWASNTVQNWGTITIPPQTANLGNGHYIQSSVDFDPSSMTVVCHMHETCTNHLVGFTAAANVIFYGGDGKKLGSAAQQLGCGSNLFQTAHADFTWSTQAPDGTQGIGLTQYWDPHNRINIDLGPLGQEIGDFFNDVGTFLAAAFDAPVEWCNQHPDDCNNLMFVLFVLGATALCAYTGDCDVVITVIGSPG
jgi:hypothetical protein